MRNLFKVATLMAIMLLIPTMLYAWTLMWDAPVGVVNGYIVEISDDNGATWQYIYGTDAPGLPLDDKCAFGKTYSFRVSAFNNAGISQPTEPLTWTRPAYEPPADNQLPIVNNGPGATPQGTQVVPN